MSFERDEFNEKVVLISGIGPGLGASAARRFAAAGARLVLAARSAGRLEAMRSELSNAGAEVLAVATDIAVPDQIMSLTEQAVQRFGGIDVVVHNAFAASEPAPFESAELDGWKHVFDVNLFGPLLLTQACIPYLEEAVAKAGDASIVFVTSMAMRRVRPGEGSYAISKGAVHTAVKSLALDLGPKLIRVNAVVPGWIDGPSVQSWITFEAERRGENESVVRREIEDRIPLGHRIPSSDDVAGAVVLLASRLARAMTGQSVDVNGGEYFGQ